MDRGRLKSPHEGKVYIYHYYNLWFLYLGAGVFTCYWGSCPWGDGIGHAGLHWLLLHCETGYSRHAQPQGTQHNTWTLSSAPWYFRRVWHLNKGLQSTTSTFNDPLHPIDPHIRCPKWSLFFDYGIKTHQGSERALETIQSLGCLGANAYHQFTTWLTGCYLCWLRQMWHAWRNMLVMDPYQTGYDFLNNNNFSLLIADCRNCYTNGKQQHIPTTASCGPKWTWWQWWQ